MNYSLRKGFTLIELLIVVAIIGILASIVLIGLRGVRESGRDARRISDIRSMQQGLELYFNACGVYPGNGTCATGAANDPPPTTAGWITLRTALQTKVPAITTVPDDPLCTAVATCPASWENYWYGVFSANRRYYLAAHLEDTNNSVLRNDIDDPLPAGGPPAPFSCGVVATDVIYCVAN